MKDSNPIRTVAPVLSDAELRKQRSVIRIWIHTAADDATLDVYVGKRQAPRYGWNCAMELIANNQTHFIYAEDICPASIAVICKKVLKPGTNVGIRRDDTEPWVLARVVQITESLSGYRTGLIFLAGPDWD